MGGVFLPPPIFHHVRAQASGKIASRPDSHIRALSGRGILHFSQHSHKVSRRNNALVTLKPTVTGFNAGPNGQRKTQARKLRQRGGSMRSHHIIAIAIVLVVGFGVARFFLSSPTAEANVDTLKRFSIIPALLA
jgi:hypothetical protein